MPAALYRREMLEDTRVAGEYFDEDFFAYREDADLAWRAQLLGWSCLYVPEAIARHGRRVTPEQALRRTNAKFRERFGYIERKLAERGKKLRESTIEEMEALWQEAKR